MRRDAWALVACGAVAAWVDQKGADAFADASKEKERRK